MYKLCYLPLAKQDMVDIVAYIAKELKNPIAAEKLSEKLINAIENIRTFPYSSNLYIPIRSLKREYRRLMVDNYIIFYWIEEKPKIITVARVIYGKRDYDELLSDLQIR